MFNSVLLPGERKTVQIRENVVRHINIEASSKLRRKALVLFEEGCVATLQLWEVWISNNEDLEVLYLLEG